MENELALYKIFFSIRKPNDKINSFFIWRYDSSFFFLYQAPALFNIITHQNMLRTTRIATIKSTSRYIQLYNRRVSARLPIVISRRRLQSSLATASSLVEEQPYQQEPKLVINNSIPLNGNFYFLFFIRKLTMLLSCSIANSSLWRHNNQGTR